MAKKAPSAYFIFCEGERAAAREALQTETTDKVSVATVAKELGRRWGALSAEERKPYQEQAKQRAEQISLQNQEASQGDKGGNSETHSAPRPAGFAASLVRRIMLQDPDVRQISADAVRATAKATELMIENLAGKAFAAAKSNKRTTIKFKDVELSVSRERKYVHMGLKDVLTLEDTFAAARGEDTSSSAKGKSADAAAAPDPRSRQITAFFST